MKKLKDVLLVGGLCLGTLVIYIVVAQFTDNRFLQKISIILIPSLLIIFILLAGIFFFIKDKAERRKKIKNKEVIYDGLGDDISEYVYSLEEWVVHPRTPITISLFDKSYSVKFSFASESPADGITDQHRNNYNDFMSAIVEKQKEIEEIIEKYYTEIYELENKQVLLSEFEAHSLKIDKNNQYVLIGAGPENGGDAGFALIIKPDLDIMTYEEYWNISH